MIAQEIILYMESLANEEQRQILMGFFKTGKGQYGEGDVFLGIKVPQTREVVRHAKDLPLEEVKVLLYSKWHEVRLCGFLILVAKFEKLSTKRMIDNESAIEERDHLLRFYLEHARQANNWDLVDMSAPKILGRWLLLPTKLGSTDGEAGMNTAYKLNALDELGKSDNLWLQRISVVCTWMTNRHGEPMYCLRYAEKHLHHKHDLMHKAVGWMLRELGKNCDIELLRSFLEEHAYEMPRTMLRYAIEKLPENERKEWMRSAFLLRQASLFVAERPLDLSKNTHQKMIRNGMNKVRITAIRQTVYTDLMAKYENPIEHTCDVVEGQQWIAIDGKQPEGMCPAAWYSMREFVESLAKGKGNFYDGWMQNPMSAMISCNDGFRPFSFYIEVIDKDETI